VLVVIGYLAAVLTSASALPQLIRTLRTRDVRGISIPSWLALALGVALWFVYGAAIGSGPLIIANAVGLVLDCAVLVLALRFRTQDDVTSSR
jgi:MtN3 and saliva related transmembrane protein